MSTNHVFKAWYLSYQVTKCCRAGVRFELAVQTIKGHSKHVLAIPAAGLYNNIVVATKKRIRESQDVKETL